MPTLHVANTSFEQEIGSFSPISFPQILESHPVHLQLQFLPFLYGNKEDRVFTIAEPDEHFFTRLEAFGLTPPKLVMEPPEGAHVASWGDTLPLKQWADLHRLKLDLPPWDVIKEINSKAFSFINTPQLPGAALLHDRKELEAWFHSTSGERVLKTCYGTSGWGHYHLRNLDDPTLEAFAKRSWTHGLPLIAEPWVKRQLDFSTQWLLEKNKEKRFLGFTLCENDERGHYRGTVVGDPELLMGVHFRHFRKHLDEAEKLLALFAKKGYFGHVGFDAMIYEESRLQPVVEINARKTMGWVALEMQKRYFPDRRFRISLVDRNDALRALLPLHVITHKKQKIAFQKQLSADFVD